MLPRLLSSLIGPTLSYIVYRHYSHYTIDTLSKKQVESYHKWSGKKRWQSSSLALDYKSGLVIGQLKTIGTHVNSSRNHNTSQIDDGRAFGYAATLAASDYRDHLVCTLVAYVIGSYSATHLCSITTHRPSSNYYTCSMQNINLPNHSLAHSLA